MFIYKRQQEHPITVLHKHTPTQTQIQTHTLTSTYILYLCRQTRLHKLHPDSSEVKSDISTQIWSLSVSSKYTPYLTHTCHSGVEHLPSSPLCLLSALSEEHVDLIIFWIISFRQRRNPYKLGIWRESKRQSERERQVLNLKSTVTQFTSADLHVTCM